MELYKEITKDIPGRFLCVLGKSEKFSCVRKFLYFITCEVVSRFIADSPNTPYSTGHWEEVTPTDEERASEIAASFGDSLLSFESLDFNRASALFSKASSSNRMQHDLPRTGYVYVIEIISTT